MSSSDFKKEDNQVGNSSSRPKGNRGEEGKAGDLKLPLIPIEIEQPVHGQQCSLEKFIPKQSQSVRKCTLDYHTRNALLNRDTTLSQLEVHPINVVNRELESDLDLSSNQNQLDSDTFKQAGRGGRRGRPRGNIPLNDQTRMLEY